ncbi:MAG: hypothetical protein EZS28_016140 [Streblomastix strix]|uniref:Uncharacterized protein n=1 Tax=Streblomastix strix TaxID=222440 RepID=A0A5J4W1D3_9EUKA|nr:MAG: hypothetical protein EZS28_016140 [Streblomastix strix]
MQHSDYVAGFMQLGEVVKTLTIHPQSFSISKQNFFDSPVSELTSSGVKYTRTPLGVRDWNTAEKFNARTTFSGKEDPAADWTTNMSQSQQGYYGKSIQRMEESKHFQFWIGFSTACGPFYQYQLMKDATALWGSAIYA